jgi:uncharacterized protein YccT (UPF0319 family)
MVGLVVCFAQRGTVEEAGHDMVVFAVFSTFRSDLSNVYSSNTLISTFERLLD